jgi:hypothetical protein
MDISATACFLCGESTMFNEIRKKDSVSRTPSSAYRVILEEMSIIWQVIISGSVGKNHMDLILIMNVYRDRAV